MSVLLSAWIAASLLTSAGEAKATPKYQLDFAGSSQVLKIGQPGKLALKIHAAPGFRISTDAPLKIKLSAPALKLGKQLLKQRDSRAKPAKGQKYATPTFEVKMEGQQAGPAEVAVDARFFVCDDKICERTRARQQLKVEVQP